MERQPIPRIELSEDYLAGLAYFKFVKLAQLYGNQPKIDNDFPPSSEEYEKILQESTKSLTVNIPPDSSPQSLSLLTGKDYGLDSRTIEIYYEIGNRATKLMLIKGKKTRHTRIAQTRFLHIEIANGHKVLTPVSNKKAKISMVELNNALDTAGVVLEKQKMKEFEAREKVRKTPLPLMQRVFSVAESIAGKLPQA